VKAINEGADRKIDQNLDEAGPAFHLPKFP